MSNITSCLPGHEPDRHEFVEWPALLIEPNRRRFLQWVGGGLVVFCLGRSQSTVAGDDPAIPEQDAERTFSPREIAAWLHIAQDGRVSVYTGKVEVGQGSRTSLTQVVAEELHLDPERIELVMGDTARTPPDAGTFGSRTTPVMSLQLRKAAASARLVLLDLAAKRWSLDRDQLSAAGGSVTHSATGRSLTYGELTQGQEMTTVVDDAVELIPPVQWQVAGTPLPKVDGQAHVTGRHKYPSDLKPPGLRYGKILRPPSFGATLESVDTTSAQRLPGVTVVHDESFIGVVADQETTAAHALRLIEANWKPNPPQCTEQDLPSYLQAHVRSDQRGRPVREKGSIADGRAASDLWLERSYCAAFIAHAPLEPRSAIALWHGEKLTLWTGTQVPFGVRAGVARQFGLPESQVRVIVADTGSGYGGKHTPEVDIEAARLARAVHAPVRVAWTREEEFTWGYFRPASVIDVAAGARKDGTLTAWQFRNDNAGTAGLETPYEVEHLHLEHRPCDAPLRQGSYRALASTVNHFARESMIDELAKELGIGPLAFRLHNLENPRIRAVLTAAASRFGWQDAAVPSETDLGWGLACGTEKGSVLATCVEVKIDRPNRDIRVQRLVTAFEAGAILNPDNLRNQVEGAIVMGLGGALFEAIRFSQGVLQNARFSRYRVPRFSDLPKIEVVLVDRKDLAPAGAGESPIVGVAPAIANAVAQATGQRLRSLPLDLTRAEKT
jgi:isoquinoline 1-oxidoreductase